MMRIIGKKATKSYNKVQGSGSSSRFKVLVLVQGSRFKVQGSRFKVHGSWFMVHGSRFMVHGSWFKVHGSWFKVHGSKLPGPFCQKNMVHLKPSLYCTTYSKNLLRMSHSQLINILYHRSSQEDILIIFVQNSQFTSVLPLNKVLRTSCV